MLLGATVTITDFHLQVGGAIVLGLMGIFAIRKWWTISAGRRQQMFDTMMDAVRDQVRQSIPEIDTYTLSQTTNQTVRAAVNDVMDRMPAGIANRVVSAIKPKPPANDPGYDKPCALGSKLGDTAEIRRRMGDSKYNHMVRELGLYPDEATFDDIKQHMQWGTYGPNGSDPLTPVRLIDCDTNHLENIIATQSHLTLLHYHVIMAILRGRYLATMDR